MKCSKYSVSLSDHDLASEKWVPALRYQGLYEVSSFGRIKSVYRIIEVSGRVKRRSVGERIKALSLNNAGYPICHLSCDGRSTPYTVHRIVLESFSGANPDKQVNHIDGNKINNRLSNLEWVTASENRRHACRVLGVGLGERCGSSKLTESDILEIRRLRGLGVSVSEIAESHGVAVSTIHRVIIGRIWSHVS